MQFKDAQREHHSFLAAAEKRALIWIAYRIPDWINSDHLTALGFLATIPAAHAWGVVGPPPVTCSNGQVFSDGGTIGTNLIVPPNTSCALANVTITGNVDVEQGLPLRSSQK